MSPGKKHIFGPIYLVLALFVLANSGFTLVLYQCTMCDQADTAPCCISSDQCGSECLPEADANLAGDALLGQGAMTCMVMTAIGGVPTDPATVEKYSRTAQISRPDSASPVSDGMMIPVIPSTTSSAHSLPRSSPPQVEKYVLNETFRI
jgi:hypothetical protein